MPERPVAKGFCLEELSKYDSSKVCSGILPKQLLLPKTIRQLPENENSSSALSDRADVDSPRTEQQYFFLDEGGEFNSKMLENYRLNVTVEVKPAYYQKWARNKGRNSSTDACNFPSLAPKKGMNVKNGKRNSIPSGKKKCQNRELDDSLNIKTVYRFRPCKVVPGFGATENGDDLKEHSGKNTDLRKAWKSLDSSSAVQEVTSERNICAFCDSDSSTDDSLENYTEHVEPADQGATSPPVTCTSGSSDTSNDTPDDKRPDIGKQLLPVPGTEIVPDNKTTTETTTRQLQKSLPTMPSYSSRRRYDSRFKSKSEASIPSSTCTPEVSISSRAIEDYRLPLQANKSSRYAISCDKVYKRECFSKYYYPVQYSSNSNGNGRQNLLDALEIKNLQSSIDCPQDRSDRSPAFINKIPLKLAQSTPVFKDPDSVDFETLRVSNHMRKLRRSRTIQKSATFEPNVPEKRDENVVATNNVFKTVVIGFSVK